MSLLTSYNVSNIIWATKLKYAQAENQTTIANLSLSKFLIHTVLPLLPDNIKVLRNWKGDEEMNKTCDMYSGHLPLYSVYQGY